MKFGIELVPNEPVFKTAAYAKAAEEQGFEYVWITDHYNNREVYSTLAVLALATARIQIGAGVTNPYTRSPVITAESIASVNEIAGGRAILGIGPGDKMTFEALGLSGEKPLAAVRESAEVIRELLSGRKITYEGERIRLKNAQLSFVNSSKNGALKTVPIYIGAQGPKMLETAGAVGDGILINGSHPEDFKAAAASIQKGAETAGRRVEEIDIAAYTCFSIDDDREKAYAAAKPVTAFVIAGAGDVLLNRHGLSPENRKEIADAVLRGDFKSLGAMITDSMVDRFAVAGTIEDCREKVKELEKAGVTQLVAGSPLGPDKEKSIRLIGELIRERAASGIQKEQEPNL